VQHWRGANWPEWHHSIVTFEFKKEAHETRLGFTQANIPKSLYDNVAQGWQEWYWDKLQEYFTKK
jgi:activator of HSP90 ATPase